MQDQPKGPGRPAHAPTAKTRAIVMEVISEGGTVEEAAAALGISEPTVRAHYARDIEKAKPQQTFSLLESAPRTARAPRPAAGGMPPHKPTSTCRQKVEILVAGGQRAWQIAAALGISEPTLRLHYEDQLQHGRARRNGELIIELFKQAKGGNVSALKTWLSQHRELEDPPARESSPSIGLGKKEAAQAAALHAEMGTAWEGLLPN